MRPLIQFFVKYYYFFLFILLEFFAFLLIFQNNYYQQSAFFNASNAISGGIYNYYSGFTDYLSLKQINKSLADENSRLLTLQKSSYIKSSNKTFIINDTLYQQQYTYLSAKVISNTINRANNYLTLNKGSKQGIKKNMGVISSQGIVGIVKDVSDNFCSVTSLLHSKSKISAKIKKNDYVGTIVWNGGDYQIVTLKDVPTHVKISVGDTIISSGYSMMFPEGILIGSIYNYEINKGKDFYEIKVKLFNDFNNISYVYIINNLMKDELNELEKNTQNE
ncbi:MAG: rod shape-determining protein MreC [Bacteroidota bacterium]